MAPKRWGRRLDRIAAATRAAIPAPAPVQYDNSCFTPEEMYEFATLLAKAEARTDGRTDLSIYTDDEIDALASLSTITAAHQARTVRAPGVVALDIAVS